ncbi:MAG: hypothetical protein ACWA5Q_09270 [bacterium]
MEDSFVDLRLNRQEGQVNESFWPSFTDIMTVIVMIFLIAMVVLLMRNMELVTQLRSTMEAERTASELARATGQEANLLAVDLHKAEERIAQMQLQVMRLQEENSRREEVIDQRNLRIQALTSKQNDLNQEIAALMLSRQRADRARVDAESALAQRDQAVAEMNLELDSLQQTRTLQDDKIRELLAVASQQRQLQAEALAAQQSVEKKYLLLADQFDDLKVRYDKLVRPARSPNGRYLVEVRYWKKGGKYFIDWRHGADGGFVNASRKSLDKQLAALKSQKPNGLYVKVIFPEDSGLSYSEAWEFTNHVHKNYDYYHQDDPVPNAPQ